MKTIKRLTIEEFPHQEKREAPEFVSVSWNSWWLRTRDYDQRLRKFKKVVESCCVNLSLKKSMARCCIGCHRHPFLESLLFGCALLRSAPVDAATVFTILATLWITSFIVDDEQKDNRMTTKQETEKS
ncbi:hypothetical protein Tco_0203422, partial [Tanacetum coccineum]